MQETKDAAVVCGQSAPVSDKDDPRRVGDDQPRSVAGEEVSEMVQDLARRYSEDGATPLIRTDFSDDAAWRRLVAAVTSPVDFGGPRYGPGDDGRYTPNVTPVSHRAFEGISSEQLAAAWPPERLGYAVLADRRSMTDRTLLYVDLSDNEGRGDTFRCAAAAIAEVEANLSIANVDFFEYAENVDPDGLYRGMDS